jgi:hypothetical protein
VTIRRRFFADDGNSPNPAPSDATTSLVTTKKWHSTRWPGNVLLNQTGCGAFSGAPDTREENRVARHNDLAPRAMSARPRYTTFSINYVSGLC